MNKEFLKFLRLPAVDRQDIFEVEAARLETLARYVEKDFWVCCILDILYNGLPQERPRILFKGGTSLSKVYGLIDRFSEDVDFTIFAEDLGFPGEMELAAANLSGKKQKKLAEEIVSKTGDYISQQLKEAVEKVVVDLFADCSVVVDPAVKDRSTLLFSYPSLFTQDAGAYVQPKVKLEGGGRSAVDPHEVHSIKPLIADTLVDWDFYVPNIITIDAQRTFWDKVFILHGLYCGYRDEDRLPSDQQRLSRHYYDVAKIYDSEIGKLAIANYDLREKVRQHKLNFFNAAWKKFDEALPGSLFVMPTGELLRVVQRDYLAMQEMMTGDVPDFKAIVSSLAEMESLANDRALL
jgi:Nucleotidyl transferase AbiEii toxin, Type IV TA system